MICKCTPEPQGHRRTSLRKGISKEGKKAQLGFDLCTRGTTATLFESANPEEGQRERCEGNQKNRPHDTKARRVLIFSVVCISFQTVSGTCALMESTSDDHALQSCDLRTTAIPVKLVNYGNSSMASLRAKLKLVLNRQSEIGTYTHKNWHRKKLLVVSPVYTECCRSSRTSAENAIYLLKFEHDLL